METVLDLAPLPARLCNFERLREGLETRGIDAIVATSTLNVFYLSGFNAIAHKSDEPRPFAIIVSRHHPAHPIAVVADYYLTPFLRHPGWIDEVRPFRAVMMPLDLSPTPPTSIGLSPKKTVPPNAVSRRGAFTALKWGRQFVPR